MLNSACLFPPQITNYRVYYTRDPSRPMNEWKSDIVNAGTSLLTTISSLEPHMIYTFRVQAETLAGPGPMSVPVRAKTQQGGEWGRERERGG